MEGSGDQAAPTVSISIISYNQAHLLRDALESALAQEFRDFEIVVSDDASTDQSASIVRSYCERHGDRIRALFNPSNGGLATNRDRAMRACRGEFIAWLDADDLWKPDKLTKQVALMKSNTLCSLSYHNMLLLKGSELTTDLYIKPPMPPANESHRSLIRYENYIPSSSVMIRASLLAGGGYHFAARPTFSDYHFFVRMAALGAIAYIPEPLGQYRRHAGSAMQNANRVASKVRQRRELALKSMLDEFPLDRALVRYALARFYISQLSGAMRQKEIGVATSSALSLLGLMPQTFQAAKDRKRNRNLLSGFEY